MLNNFSEYIGIHAENDGKKVFCRILNGHEITYQEFNNRINQFSNYINSIGLLDQSIISIKLENSFEYLIIYFSCLRSNIIINPLPDSLSNDEVKKNLETIKPSIFISRKNNRKSNTAIKYLQIKDYSDLLNLLEPFAINYSSPVERSATDTASIYYSSGTTGNPKCVEYSHQNMIFLIESIVKEFGFSKNDIFLGVLPMGHTAIINYQLLPCINVSATIIITHNFNTIRANLWDVISDNQVTNLQIVPTILFGMLMTPYDKSKIMNNKTLKYLSCGSAPLSKNIQKKTKKIFKIPVANLYGLSETGPSHFDNPLDENWEPGSIGYPLDVNICKVYDENMEECEDGVSGQIGLKGKNVFKGYFNNKEETEKVFFNDYFLTGDIGYKGKDGKFYFTDRIKDLIIKAGVNIVPGEIEEIIYKIEGIISVAIIGKTDKLFGEELVAYIEKDLKSNINKSEILNFLSQYLQPLKIPKDIRFIDKMPLGPSGKILKKSLRLELDNGK